MLYKKIAISGCKKILLYYKTYIIFSGGQDSSNTADSDDKHQTYLQLVLPVK
jgi:PP-loop superfamily ATP-utilizing enzyme